MAYSDNVLTARTFAARNGYAIDGNQEFLALGAANLASGVMQGFPVSSSGSRTVIGDSLGSRSQLYSLVALATVLLTVLFLRPVLAAFPTAALGAIVVYAATRLVDVAEFRRIARFRRSELFLALATTVAVLALDVLYGVLVAIGLSILDLLRRVARPHDGILGFAPGVAGMHDIDDYPDATAGPGAGRLPLRLAAVLRQRRGLQAAGAGVPRPGRHPRPSGSCSTRRPTSRWTSPRSTPSRSCARSWTAAASSSRWPGSSRTCRTTSRPSGFVDRVGEDRVFMTLPTAVLAYVRWYDDNHGVAPSGAPPA